MKERPILFKSEMVRAILESRKTMTRRILKLQPKIIHAIYPDGSIETERIFRRGDQRIHCPYGIPGDRLWVKETWTKIEGCEGPESIPTYRADGEISFEDGSSVRWKPSIFMPRWASRSTLEITNIRVERVQEITVSDVESEGIELSFDEIAKGWHKNIFAPIWDSINGNGAWERNDFVWVIEFKKFE